jgi:hypothetical protein
MRLKTAADNCWRATESASWIACDFEIALSLVLLIGAIDDQEFRKAEPRRSDSIPTSLPRWGVTRCETTILTTTGSRPSVRSFSNLAGAGCQVCRCDQRTSLSGSNTSDNFTIEGRPEIAKQERPITECRVVTPHYFESMQIPLLKGRDFADTDTKQTPNVVVINEAFARRHFADEDPLGHRISLQGQFRVPPLIVGVVGNVRDFGLDEQPTPSAYFPYLQNPCSKPMTGLDDCRPNKAGPRPDFRGPESRAPVDGQDPACVRR